MTFWRNLLPPRWRGLRRLLAEAAALHEVGDHAEAARLLEIALARPGAPAQVEELLGLCRMAMGDEARGLAALRSAAARSPESPSAWHNLAGALARRAAHDEAIDAYDRAIALRSRRAEHRYGKALSLLALGRLAGAELETRVALGLCPGDARLHALSAQLHALAGRTEEAVAGYRKAIALDPAGADAHCDLGAVYQMTDRVEEAGGCYRAALRLNPRCAAAHFNLGTLARLAGREEEARRCYEEAAALEPKEPAFHYELARAYAGAGRAVEALGSLARAVALDRDLARTARGDEELAGLRGLRAFRRLTRGGRA